MCLGGRVLCPAGRGFHYLRAPGHSAARRTSPLVSCPLDPRRQYPFIRKARFLSSACVVSGLYRCFRGPGAASPLPSASSPYPRAPFPGRVRRPGDVSRFSPAAWERCLRRACVRRARLAIYSIRPAQPYSPSPIRRGAGRLPLCDARWGAPHPPFAARRERPPLRTRARSPLLSPLRPGGRRPHR